MQLKEFNIALDIKKNREGESIEVVQKDYQSNLFNIAITEDFNHYSLEGLNVEIAFAKPDGTTVMQDESNGVAITNSTEGELYCILNTNTIAAAGKVLAEVRILQDLKVLTTARFSFYVRKAIVDDKTIESTNELPILNRLIGQTNDLIDAVGQIEKQVPGQVVIDLNAVSALADQLQLEVESLNLNKIDKDNIANNLTTIDEGFVLDARQGKALEEQLAELFSSSISDRGEGWIRYEDGRQECWGIVTYTGRINQAWEGLYYLLIPTVGFPKAFKETPHVRLVNRTGRSALVSSLGDTTMASTGTIELYRPVADTSNYTYIVGYEANGFWK